MTTSKCSLGTNATDSGTCLAPDHIETITNLTGKNSLEDVMAATKCDNDVCVLEKVNLPTNIKQKIEREAFKAPVASFDHNYWLNNTEIDTIMSQFRHKYPGFAHGFIHMIDLKAFSPTNIGSFDYNVHPVSEIDFGNEFADNDAVPKLNTHNNAPLRSYGVICNTDSSRGSGQHWFVVFISSDQKDPENTSKNMIRIELFNSAGGGVSNKEFNTFWETQALNISKATGLRCSFDIITDISHQSSDTGNCGSYSLFYIYSRLKGIHPSEFDNPRKPIKDFSMKKFREVCFTIDKDDVRGLF